MLATVRTESQREELLFKTVLGVKLKLQTRQNEIKTKRKNKKSVSLVKSRVALKGENLYASKISSKIRFP